MLTEDKWMLDLNNLCVDDVKKDLENKNKASIWIIIMAEDDYVYQDFAFYMKDKVVQEHHIQRVYDPIWLSDTLSKYFDVLKVTTDFDIEGIAPGEKYFYVCRKKVQE